MLRDIIISVLASSATAAVIGFIANTYLKRRIDAVFRKQELEYEARMKSRAAASDALYGRELAIYPEVAEVVYRCRNLARGCAQQEQPDVPSVAEFTQCSVHLSENLFKYRPFFEAELFRKIHRFKSEAQEFGVLLNEITRSQHVEDAPVDPGVRVMARNQLKRKAVILDELYSEILPAVQDIVRGKAFPR